MNTTAKKNSWLITVIAGLIFVTVIAGLYYLGFFKKLPAVDSQTEINIEQYVDLPMNLDELTKAYQTEIFKHPLFSALKIYVELPLQIGQTGRPDPFNPPEVQEELGEE